MLKPSYAELMEVLNRESEGDNAITSRYTIVIASAKRARQLIDGADSMTELKNGKPLSIAVDELYNGKIKVLKGSAKGQEDDIYDGANEYLDTEPSETLFFEQAGTVVSESLPESPNFINISAQGDAALPDGASEE